eukprot:3493392-Alexandrium_andersonii.AAC.1
MRQGNASRKGRKCRKGAMAARVRDWEPLGCWWSRASAQGQGGAGGEPPGRLAAGPRPGHD